jgi:hypothetical protein
VLEDGAFRELFFTDEHVELCHIGHLYPCRVEPLRDGAVTSAVAILCCAVTAAGSTHHSVSAAELRVVRGALILIPLMPTLPLAVVVLLLRFSISQMDVPTRQSYIMAVVVPYE